jgi:hypothetical protein
VIQPNNGGLTVRPTSNPWLPTSSKPRHRRYYWISPCYRQTGVSVSSTFSKLRIRPMPMPNGNKKPFRRASTACSGCSFWVTSAKRIMSRCATNYSSNCTRYPCHSRSTPLTWSRQLRCFRMWGRFGTERQSKSGKSCIRLYSSGSTCAMGP